MIAAILLKPGFWVAIAFAAALAWGGIQTMRLEVCQADARVDAGEIKVRDTQITAMGESIRRQNTAVDALAKQGAAARQVGAKAKAEADKVAKAKDGEIGALQAMLAAGGGATSTCPAGVAVSKLREVL